MISTSTPDIDVFGEELGATPKTPGYHADTEPRI
ncbi:hypothetical protein HY3_07865 [Hyphomonas pacifica]|uniref:Uncharacterized protein n=1 Tax=Hyphomonas pacifica TaxID=1280941 RepID=A0A062U387_9PROT|nr:hypothetical protein HY2_12700 [Hyphomonas pacifica]RAN35448.1 hypothetical protein HY3_07865 [Hyphomonas pacifica]